MAKKKSITKPAESLALGEENRSGIVPDKWIRCSSPNKKNQQGDNSPDTIELEKETDRLQLRMFCGSWKNVEREVNVWLGSGKEKNIVNHEVFVHNKKSSFSGSKEEEVFFFLVYHYKIVKA